MIRECGNGGLSLAIRSLADEVNKKTIMRNTRDVK